MRDLAPKSLYGRTILIVVMPIFLMQSVVTWVFFNRHWEEVTATLAKTTSAEIGYLTNAWQSQASMADRTALISEAREVLEIEFGYVADGVIPTYSRPDTLFNALDRVLDRELDWSLRTDFWFDAARDDERVEIRVQLDDGYLVFFVDSARVAAQNGHFFVVWLICATLLLGYITLIFLRNQVRSITRLADAAEAFGRGEDVRDFKPSGAREVRQAGHAFIAMRSRIRRFLAQRTEMLAGVSHDLKTPLTRMKLNLAMQPDTEDVADLKADVDEMERLLGDYLTFAQGDSDVRRQTVELAELGEDLARQVERTGRTIEVAVPGGLQLSAQEGALRRAMTNLVENALKFGSRVCLAAEDRGDQVAIIVEDDGPGIEPADRQSAIKAFSRLDTARNANVPGSGLGLAIVRDVARSHGGSLSLESSTLGGLRAVLSLPSSNRPLDTGAV